jgi:DNA adenine methylase
MAGRPEPRARSAPEGRDAEVLSLPGFEAPADAGARPFLKWAGGKKRLLSHLLPHVPKRFKNYFEPFLGGGSVFFAIRSRAEKRCFLSDLNDELINAWQIVRDRPDDLLKALKAYIGKDTEADYYEIREGVPRGRVARAARFVYLNQTAWNGLWRVNRWGVFNVPWGARPFRGLGHKHVSSTSAALNNVVIEDLDFRESLIRAKRGDFVYLDPPYLPISDTSKFSGYTEQRFRASDLRELSDVCRGLTERGVHWVLSNRDNSMIRGLFGHAKVVTHKIRRSVAAQNRRDVEPAESPEAIIIGGTVR